VRALFHALFHVNMDTVRALFHTLFHVNMNIKKCMNKTCTILVANEGLSSDLI
jgi:hypothetical protein